MGFLLLESVLQGLKRNETVLGSAKIVEKYDEIVHGLFNRRLQFHGSGLRLLHAVKVPLLQGSEQLGEDAASEHRHHFALGVLANGRSHAEDPNERLVGVFAGIEKLRTASVLREHLVDAGEEVLLNLRVSHLADQRKEHSGDGVPIALAILLLPHHCASVLWRGFFEITQKTNLLFLQAHCKSILLQMRPIAGFLTQNLLSLCLKLELIDTVLLELVLGLADKRG
mmetsp:Transcript_10197/g.19603  ORF Transcript_10197/g.19603 Transcript_10197/m.19603 type:complete len:226 (-) Transcript_10197:46-723(-)